MAVIERPKTEVWYKKQRLGSIDQMMKNIVKSTPVALSGKKLTNHSARKTLVKKLRTANVERHPSFRLPGMQVRSRCKTTMKAPSKSSKCFPALSATMHSSP